MTAERTPLVAAARDAAFSLLRDDGTRLRHTAGVVKQAIIVAGTVDAGDASLLVAAAWLHDIGYVRSVQDTRFHPLDGARHLERTGWPVRLCGLVAYHSGSRFVAAELGLDRELRHFSDEGSALTDALVFADQTTGPTGDPMAVDRRIADMLRRHGPDSPNARANAEREPYLRAAVQRVEERLAAGTYRPRHERL